MSEELGYSHAAKGIPKEPARPVHVPPNASMPTLAQQASPVTAASTSHASPTQPRSQLSESANTKRKFVPGGGSALSSGDKPGDPFATLIVLPADGVLGSAPKASGALPPALDAACAHALSLVEAAPRCVVITAGGAITTSLMTQMVMRMPGGIDSFGPGKRVHMMLKERSAPWGSLWESALLVKALAKRQAATVRFGTVIILTASSLAPPTAKVYKHVFSDWRVLVDGGQAKGGRNDALDVRVEAVEAAGDEDEKLNARAQQLCDEAYWKEGFDKFAVHPWWPVVTAGPTGKRLRAE